MSRSKTALVSGSWRSRRRWTAEDAREALEAQAQSGLSPARFAAQEGIEAQRLYCNPPYDPRTASPLKRNPPYDRRTASPLKLVRDRWHPVMRRHWDVTIEDGAGEWFVAESAEVDGRGCA